MRQLLPHKSTGERRNLIALPSIFFDFIRARAPSASGAEQVELEVGQFSPPRLEGAAVLAGDRIRITVRG
jgi:hypothetical protein